MLRLPFGRSAHPKKPKLAAAADDAKAGTGFFNEADGNRRAVHKAIPYSGEKQSELHQQIDSKASRQQELGNNSASECHSICRLHVRTK